MKYVFFILALIITTITGLSIIDRAFPQGSVQSIELTPQNSAIIMNVVGRGSLEAVTIPLYKSDPNKPFYIYINTPGGDVYVGMQIIKQILFTHRKIECIADNAFSMGFIIFELCPVRHALTTGTFLMSHHIQAGLPSQDINRNEHLLNALDETEETIATLVANRIGMKLKDYLNLINDQFWSASYAKLKKLNMVDDQVQVYCSLELQKSGNCWL